MKANDFCFWLMGVFEVAEPNQFNSKQTELIKRHLDMVFVHDLKKEPEKPIEPEETPPTTYQIPPHLLADPNDPSYPWS